MSFLLDTNVLLRSVEKSNALHMEALGAIEKLLGEGEEVCCLPQNIAEFWNVCTRPVDKNGLGLATVEAEQELAKVEGIINIVRDEPEIYDEWRQLVVGHSVKGAQVHDAKIAAAMIVHKIETLVTFNTSDFKRYTGIRILTPSDILNA
jgi:predicted nucleic acid-binding protein